MLVALVRIVAVFGGLIRGLSICGAVGAMIGLAIGFFFGLLQAAHPGKIFTAPELVQVALILALFVWLIFTVILVGWIRYSLKSVLLPVLVSSLVIAFLVTTIANTLQLPHVAWVIGLVIGTAIGEFLCFLCKRVFR